MNFFDFTVLDNTGVETPLANYKGKVLLVVNTATGCGLTPQYKALQELYEDFGDQGFEILDFPCNQFLEQAKGSDEEINQFCMLTYHTTFPRFKKIDVNGENADPLFKFLKSEMPTPTNEGSKVKNLAIAAAAKLSKAVHEDNDIKWNFTKFLVDREGKVVARFEPTVTPDVIAPAIKELLDEGSLKEKSNKACANCKFRAQYDKNPKSLIGRFWRFHIKFCPGWKAYMKSLPDDERAAIKEKYGL